MNLVSLYYFMEVAKTLNFTKAGKNLFISQQNLSKHIKNLEEHYQAQLFERKPQLKLTEAGKELLKFAQEVFSQEQMLKENIMAITAQKRGTLRLGASTPRSRIFMPELLRIFASQYPLVQIELFSAPSGELEKMVEMGQLDIAVGAFSMPSSNLVCRDVLHDHIYFVCNDALLYRHFGAGITDFKEKVQNGIQITDVLDIPLIFPGSRNRLYQTLAELLQSRAGLSVKELNIYMSTTYPQFYSELCIDGVAAIFMTQMSLSHDMPNIGKYIHFYPLLDGDKPVYHTISMLYKQAAHPLEYKIYFQGLIEKYFERESRLRLMNQVL